MNDTSPRVEALVLALLRKKTPEERFAMACDMFAASRAFMESALAEQGLERGSVEWKLAILDRTYGAEIAPAHRRRLIERWSGDERSVRARQVSTKGV